MNDAKLFSQAQVAYGMEQHTKAIKLLDQAIKINVLQADYFYWRGRAKHALKQYAEAVVDFDLAIKLNPTAIDAYYWRGLAKYQQDQHYAAIANFTKVIALNAQYSHAFFYRGQAYKALKKMPEAIADYSQAITLNPQYTEAYLERASLYEELKNYLAATADYDYLVQAKPHCATMVYNRATVKRLQGKKAEAFTDYSKSIELNADYSKPLRFRGMIYFDLQKYTEAMADFNRYLDIEANCKNCAPMGYYWRGNVHRVLGRYPEAIADYNKAIEFDADYSNAFRYRGIAKFELKQFEQALISFNRFVILEADCDNCSPIAHCLRGNAQRALGHYTAAIADYDEALKRKPHYTEAQENRALVLIEQANQLYQNSVETTTLTSAEPEIPTTIANQEKPSFPLHEEHLKQETATKTLEAKIQDQASEIEKLQQQLTLLQQQLFQLQAKPKPVAYRILVPEPIQLIMQVLQKAGHPAYLVGGSVRDLVLGVIPHDWDILTEAPQEELTSLFPRLKPSQFIPQLFKLHENGLEIDFIQCETGMLTTEAGLKRNAEKREFTLNALFCDKEGKLYDPLQQGLFDLTMNRTLIMIGDMAIRLENDPIILLRAARFAAYYGFVLSTELTQLMQQKAHLIKMIDPKPLKLELKKLFLRGAAVRSLEKLQDLNLFSVLFPETAHYLLKAESQPYQQWLIQELQTTDHYISNQKSVSMAYIYALLLTGAVLAVVEEQKINSTFLLESDITSILQDNFWQHIGETYYQNIKRLTMQCLHVFLQKNNRESTLTLEYSPLTFWDTISRSMQETRGIQRSRSYPELPKTHLTTDPVSQLLNNTSFVTHLTEFRNQSKKLQ